MGSSASKQVATRAAKAAVGSATPRPMPSPPIPSATQHTDLPLAAQRVAPEVEEVMQEADVRDKQVESRMRNVKFENVGTKLDNPGFAMDPHNELVDVVRSRARRAAASLAHQSQSPIRRQPSKPAPADTAPRFLVSELESMLSMRRKLTQGETGAWTVETLASRYGMRPEDAQVLLSYLSLPEVVGATEPGKPQVANWMK